MCLVYCLNCLSFLILMITSVIFKVSSWCLVIFTWPCYIYLPGFVSRFSALVMNIIPVFISLIILNLPNVNVFLRLIAYCNSWTKFMFIIDFVFFLSIKCLCGFYKPKRLLKPIDLQDVFEVFICLFICSVLICPFLLFQTPCP